MLAMQSHFSDENFSASAMISALRRASLIRMNAFVRRTASPGVASGWFGAAFSPSWLLHL